jgi:hypothetical protein
VEGDWEVQGNEKRKCKMQINIPPTHSILHTNAGCDYDYASELRPFLGQQRRAQIYKKLVRAEEVDKRSMA